MQDAEKYREYAADCRRLAERASSVDKEVLAKIAEAWEQQAEFAERCKRDYRPSCYAN
jgi:hypothetical protein